MTKIVGSIAVKRHLDPESTQLQKVVVIYKFL